MVSRDPLQIDHDNLPSHGSSSPLLEQVYKTWLFMSGGPPFAAALAFFEGLNRSVLVPVLPFLVAASLGSQRSVPLLVALVSGCFYGGRAVGTWWWLHRHPVSHPSARGQMLSASDVIAAGILYIIFYVIMGFVRGLPVLIVCQLLIGFVSGRDACRIKPSPSTTLVGTVMGPLLVLLSYAWLRDSSMALLQILSLTVVWSVIVVFVVCVIRDNCEPSQGHDSSYHRLDGTPVVSRHRSSSADVKEPLQQVVVVPNRELSSSSGMSMDEESIPQRYIRGCQGDMEEAARRWRETLAWRAEERIDNILEEPQPNYRLIKECYPHFLHRRDRQGHPIYYELLGRIDLKKLKGNGVTLAETLRYYVFLTEYIWRYVEPDNDQGALVSVLDVENVGIMDLRGDALEFLKAASSVIQAHYVERSYKMFIVNAPGWFSVLWRVISPLLHENTRRKIHILGKDLSVILDYVDPQCLPVRYGGTDTAQLGQSPEEQGFLEYCMVLKETGRPPGQGAAAGAIGPAASSSFSPYGGGGGGEGGGANGSASGVVYRPQANPRPNATTYNANISSSSMGTGDVDGGASRTTSTATASTGSMNRSVATEELEDSVNVFGRLRRVGQNILSPGLMLLNRVKGTAGFMGGDATGAPPQANLGMENKYVYDHQKGQWVLQDPLDETVVDESEERLIRAIQAAHCHETGGLSSSSGGSHSGGTESVRSVSPDDMSTQPIVAGGAPALGRGGSSQLSTTSGYRRRSHPSSSSSSCGPVLLFILLSWRCLSLSTLEVIPIYLSRQRLLLVEKDRLMHADSVAMVLALGASLMLLFWVVNQAYCAGRHSFLSAFRIVLGAMLINTIILALVGPLAALHSSEGAKTAVVCLIVGLVSVSLLLIGGAADWAVGILESLYKTDPHVARYDLLPALQVVDLLGAIIGPIVYYFSTSSWRPHDGDTPAAAEAPYPLGNAFWFNAAALLAAISFVCLLSYGSRPLHRNTRYSI